MMIFLSSALTFQKNLVSSKSEITGVYFQNFQSLKKSSYPFPIHPLEPRPPHSHTPPTPPTTHTTTIPDHLHEIMMRGGGQVWAVVESLCFQGFAGFLKKPKFRPLFRILFGNFFHKTGLQT